MKVLRIEAIWVFRLRIDDLPVDVHGVFILERWETREHFIDQDTQAPPIDRFSMALIQEDLGSNVLRGAAYGKCTLSHDLSEAEIDHFQISILSYHDILGLEIAIHNIFGVQVLEDRDYLCAVEDCLLEVEVLNGAMISE